MIQSHCNTIDHALNNKAVKIKTFASGLQLHFTLPIIYSTCHISTLVALVFTTLALSLAHVAPGNSSQSHTATTKLIICLQVSFAIICTFNSARIRLKKQGCLYFRSWKGQKCTLINTKNLRQNLFLNYLFIYIDLTININKKYKI